MVTKPFVYPPIIGIHGLAGNGKDTVAAYLIKRLNQWGLNTISTRSRGH